ncbi:ComEA family DNA-binding protein [Cellulomonas hominis]|uniref:ComEA family DNA-binding protein n=1 Tax=Cellulomonas hominis TaxID=156981 RepID=UPI001B97776E|nr:ComEA family DNA-binding protein [Cellulomonas hominis]VTR76842.1 ComE operon protein 1 [Cellulomonas hominis]
MTWYDGGDAPDPTPRASHAVDGVLGEPSGRARLRAAAEPTPLEAGPLPRPAGRARRAAATRQPHPHGVRWRVSPRAAAVAVLALALAGGAVALRAASGSAASGAPAVTVEEPAVSESPTSADPAPPTATPGTVWVHVVGQVAAPGLVSLPEGARVAEAVAAAGGALPDADLGGLNLAAVVQDGAQVRVPAPGEALAPAAGTGPATGTGPAAAAPGGGEGGGVDGAVDVNQADATQLQALPGIGPVLAERIVAWRTEHGAFAAVEDLQDVPGIGPAVLSRIRDRARV